MVGALVSDSMLTPRGHSVLLALALLTAISLVASACGGGDGDSAADATPEPNGEPTPAASADATTEPTADQTSEPDEATPTPTAAPGPGPAGAVIDAETEAAIESVLPTVPALATPPTLDGAAELPNDHLEDMFRAVILAMLEGPPIADAAVSGAVEDRGLATAVPDLVIRTFAIDQTITARVMGVIEAYGEAGAAGVYAPDPSAYFEARAVAAGNLRAANELAAGILVEALELGYEDRRCVAESLRDASNECDGSAGDLIEPIFDISLSDLELPDDADDDVGDDALCAAWDAAADDLGLDEATALGLDYAIDDSLTDTRFLNRSECRFLADLGEDVEPDLDPGYAVLTDIYRAAIDAVLDAGGVPSEDESGLRPELDPRILELDALAYEAVATTAAAGYAGVDESVARLHLMALVDLGASTARLRSTWASIDYRVLELGTDVLECWYEAGFDERGACDPALAPLVEEDDSAVSAFSERHGFPQSVEWDDFDDVYEDRCDAWVDVGLSYPAGDLVAIDMAVEYLETFYSDLDVRGCESLV